SGTSATFSGFVGVNGSPATAFPLEAYINSATAYTTSSRGNVLRVYNTNTGANIFAGIELGGAGSANDGLAGINATVTGNGSAALTFYTRDANTFSEKFRIASTGAATFSSSVTATGYAYISSNSNSVAAPNIQFTDTYVSAGRNWAIVNGYDAYGTLSFKVSSAIGGNPLTGTAVLNITQGGNVGIGTTPSAWGSSIRALQVAAYGSMSTTGGIDTQFSNNAYYDGTNWRYIASQEAANYYMNRDTHVWRYKSAGTAGNTITWNEAMRITSGGNVGINTTDPQGRLESKTANIVSGDATYAKKAFVANIPYSTTNITSSALAIYDGSSIHAANIGYAYDGAGYYMAFATNDNTTGDPIERMRITSGGDVGIGNITPKLNGNSGTFTTIYNASASAWLELATGSTTDGNGGIITFNNTNIVGTDKRNAQIMGIRSGANNSGALTFWTWNAGTAGERMRITSGGAITTGGLTDGYLTATNRGNITIYGSTDSILSLRSGASGAGYFYHTGTHLEIYNTNSGYIKFATENAEVLRLTKEAWLYIQNRTAAPAANPVTGGYLYCESGALKYRGSSGTVTTIANA
ncbi:MAG: hypothetical protein ACOVOV_02390, partial [Dolichospermum sp.]